MRFFKKRRFNHVTILAVSLFALCPGKCLSAYNDESGYRIAADFLNKGLYLEALGIYQEIVTHSDDRQNRATALLYKGNIYSLFLDQYEEALKQYARVINEFPECLATGEAVFNSGMVLYESGRFKDANFYFSQYIQKYPNSQKIQSAEIWAESARSRMNEKHVISPAPARPVPQMPNTTIRVLVKDLSKKTTIRSENMIKITDTLTGKSYLVKEGTINIQKEGASLLINGLLLDPVQYTIESQSDTMMLDGRRFRGELKILVEGDGFQIINYLPVEQYLYGVVPLEMSPRWPKSALMAQAVASRTYALYIKSKSQDKTYDVVATTRSQVYGGFDSEVTTSTQAVNDTQGQVIVHDGKLIVAYFHSDSGGYTEDARFVWGADLPYLKASVDGYSEGHFNGNWEYFLDFDELRDRLNQYGLNIGRIRNVVSLDKTMSGRTQHIRVVSDNGSQVLESNAFRIKVDPAKMKSTLLHIETAGNGIHLAGKGYGHGVGMSQWGAKRMAEQGYNYPEILKHYYKNTDIVLLPRS